MALTLKIPLLPDVTDQFVSVELDNQPYTIRVLWNERFQYYSLSLYTADRTPILTNIKMVKDYPLIGRFKYPLLPRDELYFVQEKGAPRRPQYGDLAVNFNLYYHEVDVVVTPTIVAEELPVALGTEWDSGFTAWDSGSTLWDQ